MSVPLIRNPNWHGPSIPPGEMLLEEFIKPLGLRQADVAKQLGVSVNRLNEVVRGKRRITADTALRLSRRVQDLAAVLDEAPGRLGRAPSHREGSVVAPRPRGCTTWVSANRDSRHIRGTDGSPGILICLVADRP